MKKLFSLFSLLSIIFAVSASEEWLYYKEYPWVWDNKTEDWLYLRGGEDGKIYAYRNSTKEWGEFNESLQKKTWDVQYTEWVQNPEPYGGLEVLQKIKNLRQGITTLSNRTLDLSNQNITDVSPILGGITELVEDGKIGSLILSNNNISDLSPFQSFPDSDFNPSSGSGLWSLELEFNKINSSTDITPILHSAYWIYLQGNDLSDEQKKECEDIRGQLVFVENRLY